MGLVSKEWIQEFHEAEGHGIDPAPLVEAALMAHELLEVLSSIRVSTEPDEDGRYIVFKLTGGVWAGRTGIPVGEDDPIRTMLVMAWEAKRQAAIAKAAAPEGGAA